MSVEEKEIIDVVKNDTASRFGDNYWHLTLMKPVNTPGVPFRSW